jgi:hypothetical protein
MKLIIKNLFLILNHLMLWQPWLVFLQKLFLNIIRIFISFEDIVSKNPLINEDVAIKVVYGRVWEW